MEWYYKDKTDGSRHGVVEQPDLFEMARKGELKPGDLVCSEQTGTRWVTASTIQGLFDKSVEAPPPAKTAPVPKSSKSERTGKGMNKTLVNAAVWGTIVVCVGAALFYYLKSSGTIDTFTPSGDVQPPTTPAPSPTPTSKPTPTPAPETPTAVAPAPVPQEVTTGNTDVNVPSPMAATIEQLNKCIANEESEKASKLLTDLAMSSEETAVVRELSKRVSLMKQTLLRVKQLQVSLLKGELTPAGIKELAAYYESRKRTPDLLRLTAGMLSNTDALTSETSLGIARLCAVLKERDQTKTALATYVSTVQIAKNVKEYIEVARMFNTANDPLHGAAFLQKYLDREATNSTVLLEFAALKCVGGDSDAALEALRKAVKYGYEDAKEKARDDDRFAPIKEKRAFKKLTSPK